MTSQKHILVVEDDPILNDMYLQVLPAELPRHTVHVVADGEAADAYLGQQPCDLVMTDLNMPRLNGVELYRRTVDRCTRESRPAPTFIFCSGVNDALDQARESCPESRNRFMLKPFRLAEMTAAIEEALVNQKLS